MKFSLKRATAIARKEVFHIMRDPFTLGAALGLPVFMVIMFGVAIEFNVRNISLAVSDSDHSQSSRELVDSFASSGYFLIKKVPSPGLGMIDITTESARAALIIPPRFEKDMFADRHASAQLLVDGSDNSTVQPVLGYVNRIEQIAAKRIADFSPAPPFELKTRFLFNPELNSRWFIIPGLNVMVMAILSILLTALTVAREYENGSMELLLSTPVEPLEIIAGKLAPYGTLGIVAIIFVWVIARTIFGVPFVGSLAVFGLGSLIFLIACLAQGLLISVTTRKQQVAMQLAMMSGMLPSQLLSGFVFPVESMPKVLQFITMLLPARWFMEISRATFLQGTGFVALAIPFLGLTLYASFMIFQGTRKFKRDLEP